MNWQMTMKPLGGVKIIVDKNCFTRKVTYRAVAVVVDVRRPNKKKPIYKQKRFEKIIPRAYKVQGLGIIMHPDIYAAVQRKLSDSVIQRERKAFMSALGVPDIPPQPKGLTLADLEDVINKFDA